MSQSGSKPWEARFLDGPCADEATRVFVVGSAWREIELAPMPESATRPPHWVVVGGDGIGPTAEPWPGQVTYELARLEPGDVGGEAG